MKMKGGKESANLVKAIGSALISAGASSAAPIYISPKNMGMINAETILLNWLEGVRMKAKKERLIKGPNCLE